MAETRRVVQYSRHGDSSVLELLDAAPPPPRRRGGVLVANRATSVNPVDFKVLCLLIPLQRRPAWQSAAMFWQSAIINVRRRLGALIGRPTWHTLSARLASSSQMRTGFGLLSKLAGPRLPTIPGGDVAGEVLEADEGSAFKPGGQQRDAS